MKFSKAQIIIKYNIKDKKSSIYAHVFEHIFVSLLEQDAWLSGKGGMIFGATNFDYINIEIELLKASRKQIYVNIVSKLYNFKNFKKYFDEEKNILLREAILYQSSDDEKLLLAMLNKSLKVPTLSVQGEYEDICEITYDKFMEFIYSNITPNQIIISIDEKDFIQKNIMPVSNPMLEITSCQLKRSEDFCTIEMVIPDMSFGKNKLNMEVLEYLNFSENNGLYKTLRNDLGLIYSLEHAYVFIQGVHLLIVEIKCEPEVLDIVIEETNKYVQDKLFYNCEFNAILNYLRVLKHNEYLGKEKRAHNLYHKLICNKETTLNSELKELNQLTKDEFKMFLKNQVVYLGIAY